ncbi:DedA family protein [Thermoplasma sp.]|uniref:DedA family protein n=1 Tax=Thermoplasma sp. TaxID=1973142 RepID=UPI002607F4B8|nr:DedA family protein [Thermoplasma sp.]
MEKSSMKLDGYFNLYGVIISIVLIGITATEIFELAELPFEKFFAAISVGSLFSFSVSVVSKSGYLGVFGLMTLESTFIPIPSEVVLPLSGYLVYLHTFSFPLIIADAVLASMVGSFIDYYLGLVIGRPIIVKILAFFYVKEDSLVKAESWIDRWGASSVFFARFIPGVRSIISIPAGMLKMKVWIFALMTFFGSVIWSTILIYIGLRAGPYWSSAVHSFSMILDQIIIDAIFIASLIYVGYFIYLKISLRMNSSY